MRFLKSHRSPALRWGWIVAFVLLVLSLKWNEAGASAFSNLANLLLMRSMDFSIPPVPQVDAREPGLGDVASHFLTEEDALHLEPLISLPAVKNPKTLDLAGDLLGQAVVIRRHRAGTFRSQAVLAVLRDDYTLAEALLKQSLGESPDNLVAWKWLGDVNVAAGDWLEAADVYQRLPIVAVVQDRLTVLGNHSSSRLWASLARALINVNILAAQTALQRNDPNGALSITQAFIPLSEQIRAATGSANLHYLRGEANAQRGQMDEALKDFRAALVTMPNALLDARFQHIYLDVVRRVYGEPLGQEYAVRPPAYVVEQPVGDYLLYGYDLDRREMELGEPLHVYLYWSSEDTPVPPGCHAYSSEGSSYCVQPVVAPNLIANAGFEWYSECEGCPLSLVGYARRMYGEPPSAVLVEPVRRDALDTQALVLRNGTSYQKSGLATYSFPVDPGWVYLQAGWVRSESGSGWLGRKWYRERSGEKDYDYVVAGERSGGWAYRVAVVQPPEDAYAAEVWLLNYEAAGAVYFDELLFIPLLNISE